MKSRKPVITLVLLASISVFVFCLQGCGPEVEAPPEVEKAVMIRLDPSEFPEFSDNMAFAGLVPALNRSLSYLERVPADKTFSFGSDTCSTDCMKQSLQTFLKFIKTGPSGEALNEFIRSNYRVYVSTGSDQKGRVLYTGYYEPTLDGRLVPDAEFKHPIYGWPRDLLAVDLSRFSDKYEGVRIRGRLSGRHFVPYYDRSEIEGKRGFTPRGDELAWVKDKVGLFFLHIQGSGKILLESGKTLHVHYHTSNGRPYRSIGKLLIDEGKIPREEMSMQRIRSYLEQNPAEMDRILDYNPSYVFFQIEKNGPLGYIEVKLTPGRSLALDRRIFPLSGLTFVETSQPSVDEGGNIVSWKPCRRFALSQDTGGAIKGPGRADLFWGGSSYAEIAAGHLKHPGKLYFLVLDSEFPS